MVYHLIISIMAIAGCNPLFDRYNYYVVVTADSVPSSYYSAPSSYYSAHHPTILHPTPGAAELGDARLLEVGRVREIAAAR